MRGPNFAERARNYMIQKRSEFGKQWFKVLHSVFPRDQDDDSQGQCCQVLLKLKISIRSDECVEFYRCECQEFSVLDTCPSFISDGRDVMVQYQCGKVVW